MMHGRLRLLYEAFPIAMLVEQAGGGPPTASSASSTKKLETLHQRTPLVFGSIEKVARIAAYFSDAHFQRAQSPLFGERGLFQL